jgi:diguanylate cyclase (GGDEF)-like protein
MDDARASDPVDRLLEDAWASRSRHAARREVLVELLAAGGFLGLAVPLAVSGGLPWRDLVLAALLTGLYALVAGAVRFPLGAGFVVPTYLILVPMLILLPPSSVPLLAAGGLLLASLARWATGQGSSKHVLFAVPNAWHSLGAASVLLMAPAHPAGALQAGIYLGAFFAGCLTDLAVSTAREAGAIGVAPRLQMRVVAYGWLVDGCIAPVGLLLAVAAKHDHGKLLMALPLCLLLVVLERDRSGRIAQAQQRLELVARERSRLQAAVRRLGDAFAAKLDLDAITSIALRSVIEALDADAGLFTVERHGRPGISVFAGPEAARAKVEAVARSAGSREELVQSTGGGDSVLAIPFGPGDPPLEVWGAMAVRREHPYRDDERELMQVLLERAHAALREILDHEALRGQAFTDALTGLGNRRQLALDLAAVLRGDPPEHQRGRATVLMLFDLDGFKNYNDTFGHPAGDALLARLGQKLSLGVVGRGSAYRLGGDEFCALVFPARENLATVIGEAAEALSETGDNFSIQPSCGAVLLPHEADTPDWALQLADQRMYAQKQRKPSGARAQTRDVLIRILQARHPGLPDHSDGVAALALAVGKRLGMDAEQLDELARAAELHDIGKVGIPDAILEKPGPLAEEEWLFIRQHTVLGERILNAAPALRPVARIVRASHERFDGEGYPDGLAGDQIPLAARIIAACDAYDAIITDRCYRRGQSATAAQAELRREAGRQFDPAVVEALLAELSAIAASRAADPGPEALAYQAEELATHLLELLAASPAAPAST